ncbi:MAG TPA: class I SAM-dependent methyltransferase [Bryobacteraceae bacterium]|nr:class I SAM-dependent methyltransferase [Bryobacteraceae bacterium]
MSEFKYAGSELDLFAVVLNWKSYWSRQIRPFLRGDILEVGAGIGANTRFLDPGDSGRYVCLEPDAQLISQLRQELPQIQTRRSREVVCGTLQSLPHQPFDTIVYIDVLEHIENDREELDLAASLLAPGGRIIVLSPAHQRLYTPFDAAIGHFRRYNRAMMRSISPTGLRLECLRYLDSAGLFASGANLLMLRQSMPTRAQLRFWDGWIVPCSRVLDKLFFYAIGKSIVAVWQKPA